jgi:hypothetical protein
LFAFFLANKVTSPLYDFVVAVLNIVVVNVAISDEVKEEKFNLLDRMKILLIFEEIHHLLWLNLFFFSSPTRHMMFSMEVLK